jgi:D-glycero-alpha-D-manno-heptose-7-phosphate kinase
VVSAEFLAAQAIRIEQQVLNETVGSQDQTAAAYGGFNLIEFVANLEPKVTPIAVDQKWLKLLNDHLLLIFTGFSRSASEVAKSQILNLKKKADELNKMQDMVETAITLINEKGDVSLFGELLKETWNYKKSLSHNVSNEQIDNIYERALLNGATGGKLLGAGNGGFMLLFVEPSMKKNLQKHLFEYIQVPFCFDRTGSQIIYIEHKE